MWAVAPGPYLRVEPHCRTWRPLRGFKEIDSLTEAATTGQKHAAITLEANVVHHEDFELAGSVKWELMQLRSRSTTPAADDVMLIARKAGLAEFLQHTGSRTTVDVVRADAWLAICTLADSIAKNARASSEDRRDKVVIRRFFGQEQLTSVTFGCALRSNLDARIWLADKKLVVRIQH